MFDIAPSASVGLRYSSVLALGRARPGRFRSAGRFFFCVLFYPPGRNYFFRFCNAMSASLRYWSSRGEGSFGADNGIRRGPSSLASRPAGESRCTPCVRPRRVLFFRITRILKRESYDKDSGMAFRVGCRAPNSIIASPSLWPIPSQTASSRNSVFFSRVRDFAWGHIRTFLKRAGSLCLWRLNISASLVPLHARSLAPLAKTRRLRDDAILGVGCKV
jgi:hypothetical protein